MTPDLIEKLLAAAVQAPSGDNVQPWRFEVSKDYRQIDLFNLPERDNSYYNYNQAASYLSHGAVMENFYIAAQHLGYAVETVLLPDSQNPDHIARFQLTSAEARPHPWYEAIFQRTTNRFHYRSQALDSSQQTALIEAARTDSHCQTYFAFADTQVKTLAHWLKLNDRIVFQRPDIHAFLFDKIRWNKKHLETTRDGMPVAVLGLNPLEKLTFPLLRFWPVVRIANLFGLARIIGAKCWFNLHNVSAIGLITIPSSDPKDLIEAGRVWQRIWLEATRLNLASQPIVGLPLLIYRDRQQALTELPDHLIKEIRATEKGVQELFSCAKDEIIVAGFRLGVPKTVPKVRTLRKR